MDKATRSSQSDSDERITVENMALLCSKNIKLDVAPVQIPDINAEQVTVLSTCTLNTQL